MKKIFSMLSAACLCIALIGCAESKAPSTPATDAPAAEDTGPAADDAAPAEKPADEDAGN